MWCNRLNANAQTVDRTWAKLPTEWIKCNVDCALFEVEGQFGVFVSVITLDAFSKLTP
jgi:hypothetical protein